MGRKIRVDNFTEGEKVVLYTTHCPRCIILERRLDKKGVSFLKETDEGLMILKGFTSIPQLERNGKILDFGEAMAWLRVLEDKI